MKEYRGIPPTKPPVSLTGAPSRPGTAVAGAEEITPFAQRLASALAQNRIDKATILRNWSSYQKHSTPDGSSAAATMGWG
jgi:hypothetical protein